MPGLAVTMDEIATEAERQLGRPLRIARFPWWLMRLAAPVWELARELGEMRYLYETPHRMDGARLHALLPDWQDTPLDQVLMQTLALTSAAAA